MKSTIAVFCLLLANVLTAPTTKEDDDKVTIEDDFFPDELVTYTGDHEIISLVVPLNALNFEDDDENENAVQTDDSNDDSDVMLFFVEADIKDGVKDYKGLYMLKGGQSTKILDDGRDATAANDESKSAYFAAKDGIYSFNAKESKAEKYGTVTDSLIGIVKENGTGVIYVLTEDHVLYKVTEEGTKKEKIETVHNPQEIVLDFNNNLYFYDSENKPHVLIDGAVKDITGLPENPTDVKLLKPPFIIEDGVPFVVHDNVYIIYANGSSELTDFILKTKPTAYAPEATLIQYYAHDKKIYEYNILALILGELLGELKDFLNDKTDEIQSIATRSRTNFRS